MKKVKVNETEIDDDLTIEQFSFKFTEEEKEKILKEFEKWDPFPEDFSIDGGAAFEEKRLQVRTDRLDYFMYNLEIYMDFFMDWIKDAPRIQAHIIDVKYMKEKLRQAKEVCSRLSSVETFVPRIFRVENMNDEKFRTDKILNIISAKETVKLAREAEKPIEKLLKMLDYNLACLTENPKKTGKPSADLNSGLVDKIAELLQTVLKITPTSYATGRTHRGGGLFFRLIKTVFEILEIEIEDPSRLIKSAVKKLS